MVAAEFGCGSGGFVIPLARRMARGLVYAIDIQEAPLSALRSRTQLERIINVKFIKGDLEMEKGSGIIDNGCDLVVMANVLFQVKNKEVFLQEAKRVIRPSGHLLFIDWKVNGPQGPVIGRIDQEEIKTMVAKLGFKFIKDIDGGEYHYGILFQKVLKIKGD